MPDLCYSVRAEAQENGAVVFNSRAVEPCYSSTAPAVWANAPRLRLSNDGAAQWEFSMSLRKSEKSTNEFCLCGCGKKNPGGKSGYCVGHYLRVIKAKPIPLPFPCECGCGELAPPGRRFIFNHHLPLLAKKAKGQPLSVEHRNKIGDANRGRKKPPHMSEMLRRVHTGKAISAEQRKKISASLRGRTFPPEAIRKLSETKRGPLNPNWRGGVSLDPYPKDWWFVRTRIRKRDGGLCLLDPSHPVKPWKHADIHHIDGDQKNCDDRNLISLCRSCHSKVEKNWEARIPELHAILSERYGYVYP